VTPALPVLLALLALSWFRARRRTLAKRPGHGQNAP